MKKQFEKGWQWFCANKMRVLIGALIVVNIVIIAAIVFNMNAPGMYPDPPQELDRPVEFDAEESGEWQTLDVNVEEFELDGTEMVVPDENSFYRESESWDEQDTEQESIVME